MAAPQLNRQPSGGRHTMSLFGQAEGSLQQVLLCTPVNTQMRHIQAAKLTDKGGQGVARGVLKWQPYNSTDS